jgi:predicted nucleic acid-binding Zn ribbon protein
MPLYEYEHPVTKEIYTDFRSMKDADIPYISEDGIECKKIISIPGIVDKNKEPYQYDSDYWRKVRPKHVKLRNGKKVKYDPNTMF